MSFESVHSSNMGPVIIITAPSGSGKTTLVKYLLETFPQLSFSVSVTTRKQRPTEIDAKDYHFISVDQFFSFRDQGLLVEWEEVYPGQFYGTLYAELIKIWERGHIVLFDVDVQGAIELKNKFKQDALTIFIKAPSMEILIERLKNRSTETKESLQKRILKAELETSYASTFEHILVNDNLTDAKKQVSDLVNHFLTQLNSTWKHVATNQ